jgi:hypothetical protein
MKRTTITVLAAAVAMSFTAATAANMTKDENSAAKAVIAADYKAAKATCDAMKDNAKDICMADAKGREKISHAELQAAYKPSDKARYEARLAKANAAHAVAKEKCDDLAGNPKDVCRKEADAAFVTAKANAKVNKQVADARKESAADVRDAEYKVAKEKCDAITGANKDTCINAAKAQYGKS